MIFCSDREQFKGKAAEKFSEFLFFTLIGGSLGVLIGGSAGLLKGIPLKRALPQSIFRSAAFFGTTSAVQSVLELGRNEKDALNPLLSGGWTGFIFGHGLTRKFRYGVALGLNGALINWALQYFSFTGMFNQAQSSLQIFNPVFAGEDFNALKDKIGELRLEINKLKEEK